MREFIQMLLNHDNRAVRELGEALQNMEEIGGPEGHEYVQVMAALKAEADLRMQRALILHMTGG